MGNEVTFADRVEELRQAYGSDYAIARMIDVHPNTVTRWRHERRTRVPIDKLRDLALKTGRCANYLIGLECICPGHSCEHKQR